MLTSFNKIVFGAVFILFAIGCKKNENNSSAINMISIKGKWNFVKDTTYVHFRDKVESTYINDYPPNSSMQFNADTTGILLKPEPDSVGTTPVNFSYHLTDNKLTVYIKLGHTGYENFYNQYIRYTILKFTKDSLNLRIDNIALTDTNEPVETISDQYWAR